MSAASTWFEIPGKITSANRVTRHVGKIALKSKSAREDHTRIKERAVARAILDKWEIPNAARVTISAYNSRLDADNLPKTILDGIKGVLIVNDSPKHLRGLAITHTTDKLGERYVVHVRSI